MILFFYSCKNNVFNERLYKGYKFEEFRYELTVKKLDQYYKKISFDSIGLIFRKAFNDEVEIFINNKLYKTVSLYNDTLSTKIPRKTIKIYNRYGKNRILLRLVKHKKMIEFCIDHRVPFYEISRYNNFWYITGDEGILIQKGDNNTHH